MEAEKEVSEQMYREIPNVYVKYKKGSKFHKKSDAVWFVKNREAVRFRLKNHDKSHICSELLFEADGERVSFFYSPSSGNKNHDLAELKKALSMADVEFQICSP